MATGRSYHCAHCDGDQARCWNLLEALRSFAKCRPNCDNANCGKPLDLRLSFKFSLGAGTRSCKVLDVFMPAETRTWSGDDRRTIVFLPFLVVMEYLALDGKQQQAFWLPYWHTDETAQGKKAKYGQWAPFMDADLFQSLVAQAHEKGYLSLNFLFINTLLGHYPADQ